jgi:hypothetical protein
MVLLLLACIDADGDGFDLTEDCNDADASVFVGAEEVCDGVDQDCNGLVDDGVGKALFQDADGDGYGGRAVVVCDSTGHVSEGGDCNDDDPTVYPGAEEADCSDPVDYNCDGSTGFEDGDGDGFGACVDCNDADAAVHPDAQEVCNGVDDDCDGLADHGAEGAQTWYLDADDDGWGSGVPLAACDPPPAHVAASGDCDDDDASISPGAEEWCDLVDQDCDGLVDEDAVDALTWYPDADADGYGEGDGEVLCSQPSKSVSQDGDCDDNDATAFPGGTEICDRADNDCDGTTDFDAWVPDDHSSIGDALLAASPGDHICVDAGTWQERVVIDGQSVTLEGADGAILDGDGAGPVVTLEDNAKATLSGFTIENGQAGLGAAVYVDGSDDVVLESLTISDNRCDSTTCRGVVHVEDSDCTLTDLVFEDNIAVASATVYAAALSIQDSDPTLDGITVHYNAASGSAVWAAGIYADNADGDWSHLDVRANEAIAESFVTASGIALTADSDPDISNFIIAGNEADASTIYGVGVWCYSSCQASFTNGDIYGNVADGGYVYGVAVTAYTNSSPKLTNVSITGNEGSGTVQGVALSAISSSSVSVSYSNIDDNDSPQFYGLSDPTSANNNLSDDPDYDDLGGFKPEDWVFTVPSTSPLVDAGDPSLSDTDGSTSDIGAYGGPYGSW